MSEREKQLKELEWKLQTLDYDFADWSRNQTAHIRDMRETVRTMIEAGKREEKPDQK